MKNVFASDQAADHHGKRIGPEGRKEHLCFEVDVHANKRGSQRSRREAFQGESGFGEDLELLRQGASPGTIFGI